MSKINWKDKCWVTTIFLVNKERKVLLNWNKVLQTWIPVGGHIDKGETPQEAIRREVEEETGFDFDLYGDFKMENGGKVQLVKFHRFQIERVPHHNIHMNFVFFGKCLKHDRAVFQTDEKEKLRWFSREEILNEKGVLESVRNSALRALEVVRF
ncbi:MAG: NUDIX domain-containing protein [Nanoarchaeota archaeon]|nr:NUDIX domain-containing protein [Nanoarchaeota archaeon]